LTLLSSLMNQSNYDRRDRQKKWEPETT